MSEVLDFGRSDARNMPGHFFYSAVKLDYQTAINADVEKQNYSVCPRFWYVDAYFNCARCDEQFCFTAGEQKTWFEEYGFWVDAFPKHCCKCRQELRELKAVRKRYDALVNDTMLHGSTEQKLELVSLIDQLYELGGELPPRINENRRILAKQLET